jgi:hypothetical protein
MKRRTTTAGVKLPTIKHRIHLACGDDSLRPRFQDIEFHNGFAYATDAHIAVKIPIAEIFDTDNAEALNGMKLHKTQWRLICGNHVELEVEPLRFKVRMAANNNAYPSFYVYPEKVTETKPLNEMLEPLWPKKGEYNALQEIGVSTEYLNRAAKVCRFEYGQVVLRFNKPNTGMHLTSNNGLKAEAVVMPVMINK